MAVDTQKKDKGGRRTMLFVRDQTRLKYTATTIDKMVFEAGVSHALRVPRYALGEYHDEYVASAAKRRLRLRPTAYRERFIYLPTVPYGIVCVNTTRLANRGNAVSDPRVRSQGREPRQTARRRRPSALPTRRASQQTNDESIVDDVNRPDFAHRSALRRTSTDERCNRSTAEATVRRSAGVRVEKGVEAAARGAQFARGAQPLSASASTEEQPDRRRSSHHRCQAL